MFKFGRFLTRIFMYGSLPTWCFLLGRYGYEFYNQLQKGIDLKVTWTNDDGTNTVDVSHVYYDSKNGKLLASHVDVWGIDGKLVASVKDTRIGKGENSSIYLDISKINLSIVNGVSGLNVGKLGAKGGGSNLIFRVNVDKINIQYNDEPSGYSEKRIVKCKDVHVLYSKQKLLYKIQLYRNNRKTKETQLTGVLEGGGSTSTSLYNSIRLSKADLSALLSSAKKILPNSVVSKLNDFDLKKGSITGGLNLTYHFKEDADERLVWDTNLLLDLSGFRYKKWFKDADCSADIKLINTGKNAIRGDYYLDISDNGNEIKTKGSIKGKHSDVVGEIYLKSKNAPNLFHSLQMDAVDGLSFSNLIGKGTYRYAGGDFSFSGDANAGLLGYRDYDLSDVESKVTWKDRTLYLSDVLGKYQGSSLKGGIKYALNDRSLHGGFESKNTPVTYQKDGVDLNLKTNLRINIDGSVGSPVVDVYSSGSGTVDIDKGSFKEIGLDENKVENFTVLARYKENAIHIDKSLFQMPSGALIFSGDYLLGKNKLAYSANYVPVKDSTNNSILNGMGLECKGNIRFGSKKKFRTKGRLEHANINLKKILQNRELPYGIDLVDLGYTRCDFEVKDNLLNINNVKLLSENTTAEGSLSLDIHSKKIDGLFDVYGLMPAGTMKTFCSGVGNIKNIRVSGKYDNPVVRADISVPHLAVLDKTFNDVSTNIEWKDYTLNVNKLQADTAEGNLQADGFYRPGDGNARLEVKTDNIYIEDFPVVSDYIGIKGSTTGYCNINLAGNKLQNFESLMNFNQLKIWGANYSDGWLSVQKKDNDVKAFGKIGSEDSFISVEDLSYNVLNKDIKGGLLTKNLPIGKITGKLEGLNILAANQAQRLRSLDGKLDLDAQFSGDLWQPEVSLDNIQVSDFKWNGYHLGSITGKLERKKGVWDIQNIDWQAEDSSINIQGKVGDESESSLLNMKVVCKDIDVNTFKAFNKSLERVHSDVNAEFLLKGSLMNPVVDGGIRLSKVTYDGVDGEKEYPITFDIDKFQFKDYMLNISGKGDLFSLPVEMKAHAPLYAMFSTDLSDNVLINVPKTQLSSLTYFKNYLDVAKSKGSIDAEIKGNIFHFPETVTMDASLNANLLCLTGFDTAYKNVVSKFKLDKEEFQFNYNSDGVFGGGLKALATVDRPEKISSMFSGIHALHDINVVASCKYNDLKIKEEALFGNNRLHTTLNGMIQAVGKLSETVVSGKVITKDTTLDFSNIKSSSDTGSKQESWNAHIDKIVISSENEIDVKIPILTAKVDLSGEISGTVLHPQINSLLKIKDGKIALPGGNVYIKDNSVLSYQDSYYQYLGRSRKLLADINGETYIVSQSLTGGVDSNQIELSLSGDLFSMLDSKSTKDIDIKVDSDVPGLTSSNVTDRLLGVNIVRDVASKGFFEDSQLVGSLLAGTADRFTSGISRALNLDAIQFTYDPQYHLLINAIKNFSPRVSVVATRQLEMNATEESPTFYSYQLLFKPFKDRKFLRRLKIGTRHSSIENFAVFVNIGWDL